MCEVIAFPNKKIITKEIEERLYGVARDYVDIVNDVFDSLDDEECELIGIDGIASLVAMVYTEGLENAINEMEWGSE